MTTPHGRSELARLRKAAGLSQEVVAERLGVDRSTVSRWETSDAEPLPVYRRPLVELLNITLERLDALLAEPDTTARVSAPELAPPANPRTQRPAVGEVPAMGSEVAGVAGARQPNGRVRAARRRSLAGSGRPLSWQQSAVPVPDDLLSAARLRLVGQHEAAAGQPMGRSAEAQGGCVCSSTAVGWWGRREVLALRYALRMSVRAFAEYLGVGTRTVVQWEAQRASVPPKLGMQSTLDQALRLADSDARARFWLILQADAQQRPPGFAAGRPTRYAEGG